MSWKIYAVALMLFNILGIVVVYAIQRFQASLPLNPMAMPAVTPDLSFNTAVSFATNTNWQGYGGESTMSYLTQMLALTVQNFVSAATGMAVAGGFDQRIYSKTDEYHREFLGGFSENSSLYFIAFVIVFALVLVSQGVPQTFKQKRCRQHSCKPQKIVMENQSQNRLLL